MRTILYLVTILAACGNDSSPPATDAPMSTIDAAIDAAVDAPTALTLNGCTAAMAIDRTAPGASRTIQISDDVYTPRCMTIKVGQAATWQGSFSDHPLAPGIIRGSNVEAQPGTPIPAVNNGVTRTVTFPTAGEWAYYCTDHSPAMAGVVYVVP